MRVISFAGLKSEKGIGFSQVWLRKLIADGEFPKPIRIGAKRVAFLESEVDQWIRDRADKRDASKTA